MDQVAYVLYVGDARLWHQRWLLGTVASCPGKAIWVSPDDDVQWESVDLSCGNISAVRWAGTIRPSPPGVGRVYRFAAVPNAARLARWLAECSGVADTLYRVVNRRLDNPGQNFDRFVPGAVAAGGGDAAAAAVADVVPVAAIPAAPLVPAARPGEAVAAEGGAAARPAIGAAAGIVAPGAWRCAAPWKGYQFGEVVAVPAGTAGSGEPPRALVGLADGSFLFLEYVLETSLDAFMKRAVSGEARVLPIKTNTIGVRERSWASVVEDMREEKIDSMPAPRTSKWCMHHVLKEGRGLEAHQEHLKTLCGLKHDQWGMEEYGSIIHILNALILVDQLDPTNTVGVEMAFRRLQTIEYAYSDRLRERMATGSTGRLTVDEQAAFGAAAKAESKLLICPALLESAKVDVERESALARALLKAREARVSLARKEGK